MNMCPPNYRSSAAPALVGSRCEFSRGFFTRVSPTQCKRIVTKTPQEYMPYMIFTSMVHTSNMQVHTSNVRVRVRVRVRQSESASASSSPRLIYTLLQLQMCFVITNVFCDFKCVLRFHMCFATSDVFCDFKCVL